MPKKFYTERDIDALHAQGVTRLDVDTNTVITALAKDRMTKLGMGINAVGAAQTPGAAPAPAPSGPSPAPNLAGQVKAAVLARLGDQVDAALLDAIIARVLTRA